MVVKLNTGAAEGNNLEKVQFGRIIDGRLIYDSGESVSTVFRGLNAIDLAYFIY